MGFQIEDGTGLGYTAKVSEENRLLTDGVQRSEREEQAIKGDAYLIGTGFVTLTSANQSAVLYFQNDNDFSLVITKFLISVRLSTGGTERHVRGVIVKNPTGITSGAGTDLLAPNINFGSSNTLTLTSEIGAEGAALTGGSSFAAIVAPTEAITTEQASTIIPKGSSIGVNIIPPASNTSLQVSVGINAHRLPED
jgi:hypothetical protein